MGTRPAHAPRPILCGKLGPALRLAVWPLASPRTTLSAILAWSPISRQNGNSSCARPPADSLREARSSATPRSLAARFPEDHLERHPSMESYFAAKWELVLRTPPGRFFAGSSVQRYASQFGRSLPRGPP